MKGSGRNGTMKPVSTKKRFLLLTILMVIATPSFYMAFRRDIYSDPRVEDIPELIEALKYHRASRLLTGASTIIDFLVGTKSSLIGPLFRKEKHRNEAARNALIKIGKPAVPFLLELTNDNAWHIRAVGFSVLGEMGSKAREAIPDLTNVVDNKDDDLSCFMAVCALIKIDDQKFSHLVELLIKGLQNEDTRLRAAYHLGEIGYVAKEAIPILTDMLNDKDTHFRLITAEAIYKIEGSENTDWLPVVVTEIQQRNSKYKNEPISILGRIGSDAKPAIPTLLQYLEDENKYVREAAAEAIKKIDMEAARKAGLEK